jgi:hypothetical protein
VTWSQAAEDFTPDGGLRDIYVRGVSTDDWETAYRWLIGTFSNVFTRDGIQIDPPPSVEFIWQDRAVAFNRLRLDVDGLSVNCLFFPSDDLELDLRPEEVVSGERFAALTGLMKGLGLLLDKNVVLTYQNGKDDAVFLEFRPQDGGLTHYKPKWS